MTDASDDDLLLDDDEDDPDAPEPLAADKSDADYLTYEKDVVSLLKRMDSNAQVVHDVKRLGVSGRKRQTDAFVSGVLGGVKLEIGVEAKRYSTPVGIGLVDAFVGKCLDTGASHGVMYAATGFTKGAAARAKAARFPSIELRTIPESFYDERPAIFPPWEELSDEFLSSHACPDPNCRGYVVVDTELQWDGGTCSDCGIAVGVCPACAWVTDLGYEDEAQCDSCDGHFVIERDSDSNEVQSISWSEGRLDHLDMMRILDK